MTETQQRFLQAIAARLGERRPVEVRLFPSMRPGHYESGVAVVAVQGRLLEGELVRAGDAVADQSIAGSGGTRDGAVAEPVAEPVTEAVTEPVTDGGSDAETEAVPRRLSILTARYRLTLKGPDRGKWEFSIVHDADAPLGTVEPVVRGVARRVGDADEPVLLDADAFARAISEPWWTTTA